MSMTWLNGGFAKRNLLCDDSFQIWVRWRIVSDLGSLAHDKKDLENLSHSMKKY